MVGFIHAEDHYWSGTTFSTVKSKTQKPLQTAVSVAKVCALWLLCIEGFRPCLVLVWPITIGEVWLLCIEGFRPCLGLVWPITIGEVWLLCVEGFRPCLGLVWPITIGEVFRWPMQPTNKS